MYPIKCFISPLTFARVDHPVRLGVTAKWCLLYPSQPGGPEGFRTAAVMVLLVRDRRKIKRMNSQQQFSASHHHSEQLARQLLAQYRAQRQIWNDLENSHYPKKILNWDIAGSLFLTLCISNHMRLIPRSKYVYGPLTSYSSAHGITIAEEQIGVLKHAKGANPCKGGVVCHFLPHVDYVAIVIMMAKKGNDHKLDF